MARFALIIGQHNAYLYRLRKGGATLQQAAALAEAIPHEWLASELEKGARCTVLTDFLDEAYTLSPLPPLWWPPSRTQLLARRLNNQYRGADLRAAIVPGGNGFKPPTMASLFNLGQSETVARWVGALDGLKVRVEGVWTFASLVAVAYGHRQSGQSATSLLVVETPTGLRQVALTGGAPVFSRLALAGENSTFDFARACDETQRTAQYLFSQSWVPSAAQPLDTRLWLTGPVGDDLQLPVRVGALQVSAVHHALDAYADALSKARKLPVAQQLLPAHRLQRWHAHQLGRGAMGMSAAILVATLGAAAIAAREVITMQKRVEQQTAAAELAEETARNEIQQATGDVSQAALAEASVNAWRDAIGAQPNQRVALTHLANALGRTPGVALSSIDWRVGDPWAQDAAEQPSAAPALACEMAVTPAPAAGAATGTAEPAASPAKVLAVLRFAGELAADATPRAAVDTQEALFQGLRLAPWRVNVRQPAFELNPDKPQAGAVGVPAKRAIEICMEWLGK